MFLAFEDLCRSAELQTGHAGDLDDRTLWCQRAAQPDNATGCGDRVLDVVNDLLVGVPDDFLDILAERLAGDGDAISVYQAVIHHRLHQHVDTAGIVHVLGDIFAARFQVGQIGCGLEDFGDIEQVEIDTRFAGHCRQVQGGVG